MNGPYVADVIPDILRRSLSIVIGTLAPDSRVVTAITADGATVETVDQTTEPSRLNIPESIARPLYEALAVHYGGTADSRQLRKDYDHERVRVDKLIESVSGIATRAQGR
ncbi:hypothetical protein CFN78_06770 [Amycolatopsis antarctica]|uniref:Uncharacterized protein n=1 Tax=Amycolatopsis antarctica TaxID=1854586 RepID=A0A263D9C9_9PSEU|nr:hypothetical protein [Amycolatopsis antarctica]OZM73985.1 hypothetical protein CFN78_06770 [Amycolatopsis antarctica]